MTSFFLKHPSRPISFYWFLIFAVVFSVQVLPRLSQDSPSGDEHIDIVDGFYYWQGDVISAAEHPPLAKGLQALPSRFMGLRSHADKFFSGYEIRDEYFLTVLNRDHFQQILTSARFITYLFGIALGLALFTWVRGESFFFVLTVMVLWAFEPILLAFSGFALAEVPLTFFFFMAVVQYRKLLKVPSVSQTILVGLLSGMAVTVKFTALLLLPIFIVLEIIAAFDQQTKSTFSVLFTRWFWGIGTAFVWVCLVYLPGTLALPGHPLPPVLFINALKAISLSIGDVFYFKGALSTKAHWDYFLTAFILKTPLTLLVLLGLGWFLGLTGKNKIPAWQWVTPLVFFLAFLFNHNMGLRMILPIYPFCILVAGRAGDWLVNGTGSKSRFLTFVWLGLLIFQALSVSFRYPAQLSYFNEFVLGDERLYWLAGPNLDIGQDTKRLAIVAKEHNWTHIKLAYAGFADPKIYGMNWNYWTKKDLEAPQPGWVYAINDDYFLIGQGYSSVAASIANSWIMRAEPTGRAGDTWRYFEVPGNIQPDHSPQILSTRVFLDDLGAYRSP